MAAGAMVGLQVEMRRVAAKGSAADYEIMLYNTGRNAMPVNLYAYDQGDQLAYALPQQVMLAEGAYERIGLHVESRKRRMFGGKKTTPFTVAAAGGGGMDVPVTAYGEFDDEPSKLPLFAGGVMGVAAAALLAFALMSGGGGDDNGNQAKSGTVPGASGPDEAATPIATPVAGATPLVVPLPPTPTPIPEPTPTPEPPPPPPPEPTPVPVRPNNPPAGGGGGGNTGGGGGGTGGGAPPVVQPPPPTPIPPPPPTPAPQRINIASISCTSSLGTAQASNAGPAASQTIQLQAAPNDTIRCTANVTGDYTSLVWTGPSGGGSGTSFTAQIGGAKPGGVPYTIGLQANWNGNPAIVNFAINVNTNAPSAGGSRCTTQGGTQVCIN
jgi:hypothetical protein